MESTVTATSARSTSVSVNKAMRPRDNSSAYSSSTSSSGSFSSSGELQYVDPDGGEPVSSDDYLPSQAERQSQEQQSQEQHSKDNSQTSVTVESSSETPPPQSSRNTFARRRNPEPEDEPTKTSNNNDATAATQMETDPSKRTAKMQAPSQDADRPVDPPNFYHSDMDFEVQLLSLRNKRVLMSRLAEVVPRGRLSMVRFCEGNIDTGGLINCSIIARLTQLPTHTLKTRSKSILLAAFAPDQFVPERFRCRRGCASERSDRRQSATLCTETFVQ